MNDRQDRPYGQGDATPRRPDPWQRQPYGEQNADPYAGYDEAGYEESGYGATGYDAGGHPQGYPPRQGGPAPYAGHPGQDPYAQRGHQAADPYAAHDPYAPQAPRPAYDPYAQQGGPAPHEGRYAGDPYATPAAPPPGDPYAPQASYGYRDPQAPRDPYVPQESYAPVHPQEPRDPYNSPDPYATSDPYASQDPYGRGARPATQEPYPPQPGPYDGDRRGAAPQGWAPGHGGAPAGVPGGPHDPSGPHTAPQAPYESEPQDEWAPRPQEGRRIPPQAAAPAREPAGPAGAQGEGGPEYHTEEFSFVEEEDEESEDVIDWLKFTESRTERREEAKRRGRSRRVALCVVLALALVGSVGYLWWSGRLPGLSAGGGGAATAVGAQKRDVLVVHLHDIDSGDSSTALLVDNETTHRGTTVLLPGDLAVPRDDGTTTTLAKSVKDEGVEPTRDSLNTLLGADVKASWRLDTPYLDSLVETVGGITVDTDTSVPGAKRGAAPLVKKGDAQQLGGQAAVAYATYRAPGEDQAHQLTRFGQVLQATLKKLSSDSAGATATVKSLMEVLDPPLTEDDLGTSLAARAELVKAGAYRTTVLPVRPDGTLSDRTADSVVKDVLGGSLKKTGTSGVTRVSVRDATGDRKAADQARAAVTNGGYSYVDGGTAARRSASQVLYGQDAQKAKAVEVARTLGLPQSAVTKGKGASNADVTVVLGGDYDG
ncbi:LytR C-terminal domain-containing protein [Streptomyces sp. NPDC059740]|uniref:LytR C-terminal domain-containing protein n=1 Tax=Streptomyces sp. NPDC059740 TaxID=3346926 RepID=UPI0036654F42